MHELHTEPKNWHEFFEFLRYVKVKSTLKEAAIAAAKSGSGNG
jgi:hypothetical protein